jgi:hypothetical protein
MSRVLQEYAPLNYSRKAITDAMSNEGPLTLRSVVLQRANAKNQNGRVYPLSILQREAQRYQQFITDRRALGELDHPESPVVNLKNVSHNVSKIWFDGESLMGDVEVLSTPSGNILKELLKNDIRLGISSRGLGSVRELGEDAVEVQEDFSLICFDIVSNPSTQGAFINESKYGKLVRPWKSVDSLIYDFLSEIK